ncbi:MAG: succinate dehydrogenase [Chlamydiota bacterium]
MITSAAAISSTFIWRRVHSLMGLWLILYLTVHLLTNSQAALWIGDDGSGFIRMVNALEQLPYLQVIEVVFIGIPFGIHIIWGVKRALTAKTNSGKTDGRAPSLPLARNRAFTWQRLTSWILLFGVIGHVVQMRWLDAPKKVRVGYEERFLAQLDFDAGLYTLAPRLHVTLYTAEEIAELKKKVASLPAVSSVAEEMQRVNEEKQFFRQLSSFHLKENQVVAEALTPGTAILLKVRDTFKSPLMIGLYTLFVVAAAFHAFNGFWTSLITWGVLLSWRSQKGMLSFCGVGGALLAFLGLAAIWGSYWINLRA